MDDIGDEHVATLPTLTDETKKWRYIARIASEFGFTGIQLGPNYQTRLGFSLVDVPEFISEAFRLTYHLGGLYHSCTPEDEHHAHKKLAESLRLARIFGAEDVSIHPPVLANIPLNPPYLPTDSPNHREQSRERFHTLLGTWLPRFQEHGITLSLETHVTSSYFLFTGLQDFQNFALNLPGLGVLIDVAHNYYDGYDIPELLAFATPLPVAGLHLSDSIRDMDVSRGTHLPIGKGHIDFKPLVTHFAANNRLYAALEVRGPSQGISDSVAYLSGSF